jgi:hypothetical protein
MMKFFGKNTGVKILIDTAILSPLILIFFAKPFSLKSVAGAITIGFFIAFQSKLIALMKEKSFVKAIATFLLSLVLLFTAFCIMGIATISDNPVPPGTGMNLVLSLIIAVPYYFIIWSVINMISREDLQISNYAFNRMAYSVLAGPGISWLAFIDWRR